MNDAPTPVTHILSPLLCGAFDGSNAWLQWNPLPGARYLVRLRLRRTSHDAWDGWRIVGSANPFADAWASVQVLRQGWQCQAEVAVTGGGAPSEALVWHRADEVTFARSTARFAFVNFAGRAMQLAAGTVFTAMVDRAACSYRLTADTDVPDNATTELEMEAVQCTGWHQLDAPGDFSLRLLRGLSLSNVTASTNDTVATGRDFTQITSAEPGGPGALARGGRNWVLPGLRA